MYDRVYLEEKIILVDFPARFPRHRNEALVRLCPAGKRVLEIGFGSGDVLYNLRGKFEELYGIEFSRVRCDKVQEAIEAKGIKCKCLTGNIENALDFPDGFFDVILWADVIEHVVDTWKAMEEIKRLLAPKGTLITTTPNVAELRRRTKLLAGIFPSTSGADEGLTVRDGELFDGGHVHYFTFSSLERLYLKYGMVPVEKIGFGRLGRIHNLYPQLLSGAICLVGRKI
ncbi:MAG: class I SAM-dependent methyltransferase [Nitrospirota bacterium]